jgi:hypothetical protein
VDIAVNPFFLKVTFISIELLTMHREISIHKRANELGIFGYILKNYA